MSLFLWIFGSNLAIFHTKVHNLAHFNCPISHFYALKQVKLQQNAFMLGYFYDWY